MRVRNLPARVGGRTILPLPGLLLQLFVGHQKTRTVLVYDDARSLCVIPVPFP